MKAVLLDDPQLQAHLLSESTLETLRWFARQVCDEAPPGWDDQTFWILRHHEEDPAGAEPDKVLDQLFESCPVNLAERLAEAQAIYRALGRMALPQLIPLAHRLLQAELHLYTALKSGKPYRDHLSHQTRVAALSHLWLTEGSQQAPELALPEKLRWSNIRRRWARTAEFHLLRCHALRLGLSYPDPAEDDDPWGEAVASAALLAGLAHDVGYVQKSLGQVSEPVAQTFTDLIFQPKVELDPNIDQLPLAEMYRALVSETEHGQRHAKLASFLERHYRELHSIVGAIWLATLPSRLYHTSRRVDGPAPDKEKHARTGWTELVLQLAALMAFGHDLALCDEPRRKVLGLREAGKDRDALNLEDFPLCTMFALCDVMQEFGRPVRVIDGDAVRFVVPLAGVKLELVGGGERTQKQGSALCHYDIESLLLDLPALQPEREPRLYLSFCSREDQPNLLTKTALRLRTRGTWDETRIGDKVPEWLERAGLSDQVRLDGDPTALKRVKKRFRALYKKWKKAEVRSVERRQLGPLLQAMLRVLKPSAKKANADHFALFDLLFEEFEEHLKKIEEKKEPAEKKKLRELALKVLLELAPVADTSGTEPLPRLGKKCLMR
jgi:hypothetical protein